MAGKKPKILAKAPTRNHCPDCDSALPPHKKAYLPTDPMFQPGTDLQKLKYTHKVAVCAKCEFRPPDIAPSGDVRFFA
jgi:hypothetical protein